MSLYDDVILPDIGIKLPSTVTSTEPTSSKSAYSSSSNKSESQSDIANWNTNSLKLLQYQVEAVKKRQMTLSNAIKRDKSLNVSPSIKKIDKTKSINNQKKDIHETKTTTAEIRFNSLTGKIEKDDSSSLFASSNEEYDPMRPNEYEKVVLEIRKQMIEEKLKETEQKEAERKNSRSSSGSDRDRSRDRHRHKHKKRSSSRSRSRDRRRKHSSSSTSEEDRRKRKTSNDSNLKRNLLFAPPPSLLEDTKPAESSAAPTEPIATTSNNKPLSTGLLKAEKMMAKMGYKEGEGLGKNNQGMSVALQVEKTGKRLGKIIHEKDLATAQTTESLSMVQPPPTPAVIQKEPTTNLPQVGVPPEVMKNMSKVVLLRNMVIPPEVDDDLEAETKEECQKYGEVASCVIYVAAEKPDNEAVRIFVEFKTLPSAIKALTDLNGRFFGGRSVKATFYNFDKFKRLELADEA